jgi:carboxylesterase type B
VAWTTKIAREIRTLGLLLTATGRLSYQFNKYMGKATGEHIRISHPQLGIIKGIVPLQGVHQFRSLPYATIPHRFADPVLAESLGSEGKFDATKFGPIAPQPDDAEYQEFVTPNEHIPHEPLVQNEFRCCNLNISVPTGVRPDPTRKGLPVMVWFHGGNFMLGSASWPQYGECLVGFLVLTS